MSRDDSLTGDLEAAVLLRPTGRLEQDTCTDLRQRFGAIFSADVRDVVVDLRDVTALDVAGVQVLAGASRHLRSKGGSLTVTHADAKLARILRINGEGDLVAESRPRPAATPAEVSAVKAAAPSVTTEAAVSSPVRTKKGADLRVVRD